MYCGLATRCVLEQKLLLTVVCEESIDTKMNDLCIAAVTLRSCHRLAPTTSAVSMIILLACMFTFDVRQLPVCRKPKPKNILTKL